MMTALNKCMTKETDADYIRNRVEVDEQTNCWNWTKWCNHDGYGFSSPTRGEGRAHRLSYRTFKGTIDDGLLVCHTCHNPSCCNPEHLYLGSARDNMTDKVLARRQPSKLNEHQVIEIFQSLESTATLAKRFGVLPQAIMRIKQRRNWKHITANL